MSENPTSDGNGKIVLPYKWRDEEGQFDLSDPDDLAKAQRLVNQGYGYEKGQQELKTVKSEAQELRTQVEYWNSLIEDAKDSGDVSKVQSALELAGVRLSKSQSDDDDFILDEGSKKFDDLTKKIDRLETALYKKYTGDIHTQLEAKYNNGIYPEYNQKEVEDFADKKGIREFEDAYFIMHKDEILEIQDKLKKEETTKHKDKINRVASKPSRAGNLPPKPVERNKNYGKVTESWLKDPEITGNLFLED